MKIECSELIKNFGKYNLFDGMTFTADSGVNLLLGKNGSGKTTWIKMALELESKNSGDILYSGKAFEQVRDEVAIVFDEPPIYSTLSGYNNLYYLSGGKSIHNKFAKEIIKKLQLSESLLNCKAKAFSFGQRHRLAVASALIRDANYIFLDEHSVGLDSESWDLVKTIIRKEADKGKVIILTGHNYELLEEITDKVVIIHNKKVAVEEQLKVLLESAPCCVSINVEKQEQLINLFGYKRIDKDTLMKNYKNKNLAEEELVRIQKQGNLIKSISIKSDKLRELTNKLIKEDENE